jgi:hypothetical protein
LLGLNVSDLGAALALDLNQRVVVSMRRAHLV